MDETLDPLHEYYCILHIASGAMNMSENLTEAANWLEPGCICGRGLFPEQAVSKAYKILKQIQDHKEG